MKRTLLLTLLIVSFASFAWSKDKALPLTVTVVAVETDQVAQEGTTYDRHKSIVKVDDTTLTISRAYRRHETWLHKGTYQGRWADTNHRKLEVEFIDNGKTRRLTFDVLSEE